MGFSDAKQGTCLDLIVELRSRSRSNAISQTLDLDACVVWSMVQAVSECIRKFGSDRTYIWNCSSLRNDTNHKSKDQSGVRHLSVASDCDFTKKPYS